MIAVAVIGSGPSGVQAACEAVEAGLSVAMFDVGIDEPDLAASIPEASFSTLRRTDPNQRNYFLGDENVTDAAVNDRVGAHFTPPRAYIKKRAAELSPIVSDTFFPEQSLALGGLGAGWGSGCQTFEKFELERAGLPASGMAEFYESVARNIGISGAPEDDTGPDTLPASFVQGPAEIDTNAASIFSAYARKRAALRERGFLLGRAGLAMLTTPLAGAYGAGRRENPYLDMDFYADFGRSIYRPKISLEVLKRRTDSFTYHGGVLMETYVELDDGVRLRLLDLRTGRHHEVFAQRLILAANPLNSARIALRSNGAFDERQPILCNPYHYVAGVNLRMFGKPARDRRHSLAQLIASYTPQHRNGEHVFAAFFSYRSLMHFRLVREMPLPTSLGLIVSRTLQTALTVVGVHHPENPHADNYIGLRRLTTGVRDALEVQYVTPPDEHEKIQADLKGLKACLRALGIVPFSTVSTLPGSSIHYAGTVPFADSRQPAKLRSEPNGRIVGTRGVYLGDASPWKYLPAKGPTYTLMANARRVAREVVRSLRS